MGTWLIEYVGECSYEPGELLLNVQEVQDGTATADEEHDGLDTDDSDSAVEKQDHEPNRDMKQEPLPKAEANIDDDPSAEFTTTLSEVPVHAVGVRKERRDYSDIKDNLDKHGAKVQYSIIYYKKIFLVETRMDRNFLRNSH